MNYFQKVREQTPTRFWVNNPTRSDAEKAIAIGAINVTTNPSFCSQLMKNEELDYVNGIIDEVIGEIENDDTAADIVFQKCVQQIMKIYIPRYERTNAKSGYVTIQDNPRRDNDTNAIIDASIRHSKLGPNYMAKIPVIKAGMAAIEYLIEKNIAICATEVFSIAQAIDVCELYKRTSKKTGNSPPFFVTHITGIYDQYLKGVVEKQNIDIASDVLYQAGCIVAYQLFAQLWV